MKHDSLSRTLAVTLVCAVAIILAVSFVGYVGERLVTIAAQTKGR
jgi:hypothetical protein